MKIGFKITLANHHSLLLLIFLMPLITSFNGFDLQDSRRISRDGMAITLPTGWKLTSEKVEDIFNIYTAENRNAGSINFYRAPIDYSLIGDDFFEDSSKTLNEIYNNSSMLAISMGLESSTRKTKDYTLYGKKEIFVCREKKVRVKSFRLTVEYYQLSSESEVINIITSGENYTSDISDIDFIMKSFTIE